MEMLRACRQLNDGSYVLLYSVSTPESDDRYQICFAPPVTPTGQSPNHISLEVSKEQLEAVKRLIEQRMKQEGY